MDYNEIKLTTYFNNIGSVRFPNIKMGDFAFGGFAFPYEELINIETEKFPLSQFSLCSESKYDNFTLEGQEICLPYHTNYIVLIGASNDGDFEDDIILSNSKVKISKKITFPDYLNSSEKQEYNYKVPYIYKNNVGRIYKHAHIWIDIIETQDIYVKKITFPFNPSIHIFGIYTRR